MKKYKIKVPEIEAFQMTQDIYDMLIRMGINEEENPITVSLVDMPYPCVYWNWHTKTVTIDTVIGECRVRVGDYILKDSQGIISVKLKDKFESEFEAV